MFRLFKNVISFNVTLYKNGHITLSFFKKKKNIYTCESQAASIVGQATRPFPVKNFNAPKKINSHKNKMNIALQSLYK